MRSVFNIALGLALLALSIPSVSRAHHSATMYDFEQVITIEGTVKEFLWTNPHVMMWVSVPAAGDQPAREWQLENTSPGRLMRLGWNKNAFKPGTPVKVEFWPLRSGKSGGFVKLSTNLETNQAYEVRE